MPRAILSLFDSSPSQMYQTSWKHTLIFPEIKGGGGGKMKARANKTSEEPEGDSERKTEQ